ncbi:MAG: hypothetical protein IKR59_03050, partial [Lachnospiraceae bacterium]|nr:hypothetical protein [Lachnospiraceae bacterium]
EGGGGYPPERVVPEQRNKKILDKVKTITHNTDLCDILTRLDPELTKGAFGGEHFKEYFFRDCGCEKIAAKVREIIK